VTNNASEDRAVAPTDRQPTPGIHDNFASNLMSQAEPCPVCSTLFRPDDLCATDIELGICHAKCLEGSPAVDLDTGEPAGAEIATFRYSETDLAQAGATPSPESHLMGWQDISAAPKDGRDLLLSAANWHGDVVVGCWSFQGWRDRDDADALEPTHWMPLPAAPNAISDASAQPYVQGVWDEIGAALALLSEEDASPKARALIREALESATGCKAPLRLFGPAEPINSGEAKC
jgi:hypothetical protein